ncbi:MAG: hypothetical protein EOP48_02915 [Sphingobacteriales bacterium]|nr:MAG: hypothetical protein EOP48_02915 [Sphingobacteriales bacterium]
MIGQEFVLKFEGDKASLTPTRSLDLIHLKLESYSFFPGAYWKIRVVKLIPNESRLFCEVLSYQVGDVDVPRMQQEYASTLHSISSITFRSVDTSGLLQTARAKKAVLSTASTPMPYPDYSLATPVPIPKREPIRSVLNENFMYPIKDLQFKLGGVELHKTIKHYPQPIYFTIENFDIREEFDAIKGYFANILGVKKISVSVKVELEDGRIVSKQASSPEITKINKEIIESVKFEFVKDAKKKVTIDVEQSIFTMEEFLEKALEKRLNTEIFYQNEVALLEDLMKISDTKHYRNLRYLANQHLHGVMKLRFVLKPFSFVFLLQGESNYHVVWETLDTSEATYIWHFEKDVEMLKRAMRKVNDVINLVQIQGKTAYINSTEDEFRRIYHDYSDLAGGFVKWKGELESVLI